MDQLAVYIEVLRCGIAGWMETWGDPFLTGVIFMVSYALAAGLILRIAFQTTGRECLLWQFYGVLFSFHVPNTHLDLHAFSGTFERCLAHAQGWYESRRQVQMIFLIAVALCALLVLLLTLFVFHKNIAGNLLLATGVAVALGITAIKGINHHDAEQFYGSAFGAFRGVDLIELSGSGIGIALIAATIRTMRVTRTIEAASNAKQRPNEPL